MRVGDFPPDKFIYGYMQQVSKKDQLVHLRRRDAQFPFGYSLTGHSQLFPELLLGESLLLS